MRSEDDHSFVADDPVARYWLHNCVGFGVRGLRSGPGVVRAVSVDDDGVPTLAVIRRGILRGTAHVSAGRVERVDPWDETIVLRSASGAARPPRTAQVHEAADEVAAATRGAAAAVALGARMFLAAVATFLLALAAVVREHAPGTRARVGRFVGTLAAFGHAYAVEARRAYRAQREAVAAWQQQRRRDEWGDESPPTRAGADEVDADARSEEQIRR